ncbi:MAG: DUF4494 domain-containing protein [Flavobacteriales bacterium]|jgi:hypothetical protein
MTKHWFTCKVKYVRHDSEGAEVKATESFVLDAYNYTEAETRMTEICEQEGIRPFEIIQITKSPLSEVIRFEDADKWFKIKIALTSMDEEKGVEKELNQFILLSANDVRDAYDKVSKHMSKVGIGFVIPSIAFQKITEVFPLEEQGGSNPLASTVQTPAHHMEGETGITQDSVDAETGEVLA